MTRSTAPATTRTDLLAILPGPPPSRLPEGAVAVQAAGFAALLMPPPVATARAALLRHAAGRQSALEALMAEATVLPALAHTPLAAAEAGPMLEANAPMLRALADRLEGRVQYQVQVGWDPAGLPARFPGEPAEAVRARLAATVAASLAALAEALIPLPLCPPVIANHALLLPAAAAPDLDRALERIDALWTEGLSIRQIGPSPAVSFASIALRRVSAAEVGAARRRLGLEGTLDPATVAAARRHGLMTAPEAGRAAIREAAELLAAVAASPGIEGGHLAILWQDGRAEGSERRAA